MTDVPTLIRKGDVDGVARAVRALDDAGRRALMADLPALLRRDDGWWQVPVTTALAVATVGCAATAAKAATVLARRDITVPGSAAGPAIVVAGERGVTWLADLGYRIADRMRRSDPSGNFEFAAALLAHEKAPPPADDAFVQGWAEHVTYADPGMMRADRLRADPFLDAMVPRLFAVDGLGTRIDGLLVRALVALAAEGRLDRGMLLDGCVGRMLRGDRPVALRTFATLHDALEPTPAEITARAGDYLRLLADAPAPAANLAQKVLRTVTPDLDALLDASRDALTRPAKAFVRAQLTWLDTLARDHRDRAPEIAAVIAVAADHPAADVADRATALAAKHGVPAGPVAGPVATVVTAGDDLPLPPPVEPFPPPITDPDELAEEVAGLVREYGDQPAPTALERALDGLVRLAATDLPATARALAPVLARVGEHLVDHRWEAGCLHGALGTALRAVTEEEAPYSRWTRLLNAFRSPSPAGAWAVPTLPAPQAVVLSRLAEIGQLVRTSGRAGGLVAYPVWANGAIDASVLVERLASGGEPWPADFAAALLRLPAAVDEASAARADALRTPAGDRLAAWLRAGGLPRPTYSVVTVRKPDDGGRWNSETAGAPDRRVVVAARPPDGVDDVLGLLTRRAESTAEYPHRSVALWPWVLPGYRGLVAAWVQPGVAAAVDMDWPQGATAVLTQVAECTGDGGPGLEVALAYGLAARDEHNRVAALDAVLALAALGRLDAAGLGTHLGQLSREGLLTPSRCVGPLRDAAAAGARLTTWRVLAAALPPMLAMPRQPRGLPDLLTIAASVASGSVADVPGLAEVAARGGSTRLVTEAKRLVTALG